MNSASPAAVGQLVGIPPDHPSWPLLLKDAQRALQESSRLHLFFLDRGVLGLQTRDIERLHHQGTRITACALATERHHIPPPSGVVAGGLLLLANLLTKVDCFRAWLPRSTPKPQSPPDPSQGGRRKVLVRTFADPGTDPLAAEGCRVAAGLAVHTGLDVRLWLAQNPACRTPGLEPATPLESQFLHTLAALEQGGTPVEVGAELPQPLADATLLLEF